MLMNDDCSEENVQKLIEFYKNHLAYKSVIANPLMKNYFQSGSTSLQKFLGKFSEMSLEVENY
mgnify:CR=1 FL=1